MIRITGGAAKGAALRVYDGGQVRPTSDKVRQALFNILTHRFNADFQGARVLDLFAGAGGLGCEALSHGAREVVFVEADPRAARVISQNLSALAARVKGAGRVVTQRAEQLLSRAPDEPFALILMDPPYADGVEAATLRALSAGGWLAEGGYVVVEHSKRSLFEPPDGWQLALRRLYGDTAVSICARAALPPAP
ncbi:MAG: 16S rRNA (guanine(966)-N(2))-methyltransferase RsmD, partial [Deltaproteobacteria bacterium]|nr:16S rRNA (guanine(966)-N(2))-methyltransferase RsmD [Deltaproteobacteria bacterium]